jgi:hypothetical protein
MTKIQLSDEEAAAKNRRLPAWLAECMLTGLLAGLGGAVSMLWGHVSF